MVNKERPPWYKIFLVALEKCKINIFNDTKIFAFTVSRFSAIGSFLSLLFTTCTLLSTIHHNKTNQTAYFCPSKIITIIIGNIIISQVFNFTNFTF